jgi:hypothetical protein
MVKVAPTFVQEPAPLYVTARPESDVAATVKLVLKAALARACVPTVIVWFTLYVMVTDGAPDESVVMLPLVALGLR